MQSGQILKKLLNWKKKLIIRNRLSIADFPLAGYVKQLDSKRTNGLNRIQNLF